MVPLYRRRSAQILAVAVSLLLLGDLACAGFRHWMNGHQVVSGLVTEGLLLAAVYLVVDHEIARRQSARSVDVSRAVVSQLASAALGVRTAFALPALLRFGPISRDRFRIAQDDNRLIAEVPAVLAEEARRMQADELPLGTKRLDESVDENVAELNRAFTTWAPGVVGKSELDRILNRVPLMIERAAELSTAVKRGLGLFFTAEDLHAGAIDTDKPAAHAREDAGEVLRQYLTALREFDAERHEYLGTLGD
jgi:hypothetical protein